MVQPSTLRTNFSWTLLGNVVYSACQWAMLMVLAKLLTPEHVGLFAYAIAITGPVFLFAGLQLRQVLATDARAEVPFGRYLRLRLLTSLVAAVGLIVPAALSLYPPDANALIIALAVAKAIESVSDVHYGLYLRRERMDRIARSLILRGSAGLAALGLLVIATRSVEGGVLGLALVWLVGLVFLDLPASRGEPGQAAVTPSEERALLLRLAWRALPLGFVMLLVSLNANVPRYSIQAHLGSRPLGIFAALASPLVAGQSIIIAMGEAASPRLARLTTAGDYRGFTRLLGRLLLFGAALGALGWIAALLIGRPAVTLLFTAEYAERQDVLLWVLVAAGISYLGSFLGYGMVALRIFRLQVPLFAVTVATTALASSVLVPRWGLVGASWALCISALVQLIGASTLVGVHLRLRRQRG